MAPMTSESGRPTVMPSFNRMVAYTAFGTPGGEFTPAAQRAAVVTEAEYGPDGKRTGRCKLAVLNPSGIFFSDWLSYDSTRSKPGTWNWPERQPDQD